MDEVAVSSFSAKRNKPNLAAIKNVAGSVSKTVKKVTSLAARKEDDGDVNDLHNKEIDDDEFDNYFSSLEIIEKPDNKSKRNRRVSMTRGHSSNTNGDSAQWQFSVDAFGDSFDDSSSDEENDVRTQEQQQAQQQQQQQQQPEKAISTIEKSSATKAKAQKDKKSSVLEAGVKKNRQKMQGSLDECITMELPLDSFLSNNNKNSNSLDKSSRSGGKNSKKSSIKSSDSRKSKKSAKSLPVSSQSRTIPRKSFWQFSSSDDDDDLHTSTHSTMSATRKRRSSLSSAKKDCLGTSTHSTMTATRRKRRSSKKEMETSAHSTRSASRRKTPSSSKKDGSSSTTPLRRRSSKTNEASQDADDDDRIDSAMNKFSPGRQRLGNKDDPPVTPVRQRSRSIEIKVDKTDEDDNTDSVISAGSKRSGRRKKEQSIRRRSKKDEVDNDAGSIVSACSKRSGKKKSLRRRSKKDKIEQDDDDNDETGSIISAGSKRSRKKNRTPTRRRSKGGEFKHGHGGDNHKTDAGSVVSTGSRRGRKREKLRSGRRICSSAEKKEGVMDDKQVVDETSDDDSDSFAVDKTNDSLLTKQNVRQEDNDRTENIVDNPQDALASPTKSKSKSARFRTASKSVEKGYDASSKGKNENAERNNQSRKLRIAAILNQRMVEIEDIEQILEEDRLSMVQEREELLDERNKLKSKLYEKIQKNEFLQGIIDRGLNFSMDSDKNDTEDSTDDDDDDDNEKADDHQNFLGERVACENEELEAQIQTLREDYRVEAHKLESEIQDLHTSIKKKLRSANGDPLAISMHKANGDLLRTRSNLSNLDSTIQREQALIDELTMELQGYRHGSVTQALEQEIADLKAENEEVELEFETEKNEMDETLKGKGETLALLINQLEKLKQQQEAPPPPPTVAESPFSFVKRLTSVVGATMGQPSNDALPPDDSFLDKSERSVEATFKTLFGSSPESVLAARRKAARPPASDSSMPIL